jgi:hypothetical protein
MRSTPGWLIWSAAGNPRWPPTCEAASKQLEGRLTVRQASHRVEGQLRLDPVKTDASVAVLPIPDPLVTILRAHRRR